MAQQKYIFAGYTPERQPDEVKPKFAVTSTEDSGRVQSGIMYNQTMFTVEAYDITFSRIGGTDVANLLQRLANHNSFQFYHYNVFRGQWEESPFYAANFDCSAISLREGKEAFESFSFQVTGINPV